MTGFMLPMEDEISPNLIHVGMNTSTFGDVLAQINDIFGGLYDASAKKGQLRCTLVWFLVRWMVRCLDSIIAADNKIPIVFPFEV